MTEEFPNEISLNSPQYAEMKSNYSKGIGSPISKDRHACTVYATSENEIARLN